MSTTQVTFNEVLGALCEPNAVGEQCGLGIGAISGVIKGHASQLLSALGDLDPDTPAVGFAILPTDTAISAIPDELAYLKSRNSSMTETLLAHLSAGTPVDDAGAATGDFESLQQDINSFATYPAEAASLPPLADRRREGDSRGWYREDNSLSPIRCQSGAVDLKDSSNDAVVCTYSTLSETTNFILPDNVLDAAALGYKSVPIGIIPSGETINGGASGNQDLETVLALLGAHGEFADLSTASGESWFTVFAPITSAFDNVAAADATIIPFLLWNKEFTQKILKNHILASPVWSEELNPSAPNAVASVGDNTIVVDLTSDTKVSLQTGTPVFVNTNLTATDIYLSNAVVHTIDNVLVSNEEVGLVLEATGRRGLTTALDSTTHATLISLATREGQEAVLNVLNQDDSDVQQTLFAPTEAAFAKLAPNQVQYLLDNPSSLSAVLTAHVATTPYFSTGASNFEGNEVELLSASGWPIDCGYGSSWGAPAECYFYEVDEDSSEGLFLNVTNRRYTDLGVVYDIDTVIIPATVADDLPAATFTETTTATETSTSTATQTVTVTNNFTETETATPTSNSSANATETVTETFNPFTASATSAAVSTVVMGAAALAAVLL